MPTVAILPWLWIDHEITLNEYRLVPVELYRHQLSQEEVVLVYEIVSRYYEAQEAQLHRAVIAGKVGQPVTAGLRGDEQNLLFDYVELLACAGLSAREFFAFHRPYCNRDNFQLAISSISGVGKGINYSTRRRDGHTKHMTGKPRFDKPDHVDCRHAIAIDESLLSALLAAYSLDPLPPWWEQVFEAILSFNRANTDSESVPEHIELISLVSAFQRLLGTGSDERRLNAEFIRLIVPSQEISKAEPTCTCLAEPMIQPRVARMNGINTVREVWLRDLCTLRGNVAHGKIGAQYNPIWSIRNHLLLASHIFPLLLKAFLAQHNIYNLSGDDRFDIDLFERRACEDHFAPAKHHPWNGVAATARYNQIFGTSSGGQLAAPPASAASTPSANP